MTTLAHDLIYASQSKGLAAWVVRSDKDSYRTRIKDEHRQNINALLEFMGDAKWSTKDLAKASGINLDTACKRLRILLDEGAVKRENATRYRKLPYLYSKA